MQTLNPNEQFPDTASGSNSLTEGGKIGGCYVLRRDLTRTGGPSVWLASDEVLGKEVTLHVIPAAVIGDASAMAELRQEVKRNRQLIHPNILRVYDLVEDGNRVAVSMDRFEGESLAEVLKRKGRLDPDELKPWLGQLAETLGDAHRIQLFHRDLAPSNLYVRPAGGLLVANFGLSRVVVNSLERAGVVKGEDAHMAYLSPQQLDGERGRASDDIYGFGVLLFELLGGKPPFSGEDIIPQIRKAVPPTMAEVRATGGAQAPVPPAWEKLIAACLAKTPEGRPRNLADVVTMLGQERGGTAVRTLAAPPPNAPVTGIDEVKAEMEGGTPAEVSIVAEPGNAGERTSGQNAVADQGSRHASATNGESSRSAARENTAQNLPPRSMAGAKSPEHMETPPIAPKPPTRKTPVRGSLSANFPDLDRPRSKAPLVWLLLAAAVIGGFIYLRNMPDEGGEGTDGSISRVDGTPGGKHDPELPVGTVPTPEADSEAQSTLPDPTPVKPAPGVAVTPPVPDQTTRASEKPAPTGRREPLISEHTRSPAEAPPTELVPPTLAVAAGAADTKPAADSRAVTKVKSQPDVKPVPPVKPPDIPAPAPSAVVAVSLPEAPQSLPKLVLPVKPTAEQLEQAKKERETAIARFRQAAAAAEAAKQESTRRLEAAKTREETLQRDLDARQKALTPVIQQAEALELERKKLEEGMVKAKAVAVEAAKAAESAKQAYDDAVAKGGEKLKARTQAETELRTASAELASRNKEIENLAQMLVKADALHQQALTAQQPLEQDLQEISSAFEKARRADMEQQRKADREKVAALEKSLQDLKKQAGRFSAALGPLKELGEAGKDMARKIEEKLTAVNQQISEVEAQIDRVPGANATDAGKAAVEVAPTQPAIEPAQRGVVTNSLGMKFAPIGNGVHFGVYLVTRKDFEVFANAVALKSEAWRNPGFQQDPDHPVVNVTWREAEAFCKWLTGKERKAGLLKAGEAYRLPTDLEWSKAVGLPPETGATPEERDMGVKDVYPWGAQWPPPPGAGNYAGEETQTEIPIQDYNDGYANTSPVGKFRANAAGLYDMGGNVWQWVSDFWNSENRARTLRGGSWYNGAIPLSLLSSCRISSSPDTLHDTYGFRIVKAVETGRGKRR